MKQVVMKVKHFFNVKDRDGATLTILGGSLQCDLCSGEMVEIHTVDGDVLRIAVEKIKCYKDELEKALDGLSCGLGFSGISHMQFRITEPIVNPHNPKTNLKEFLEFDTKENVAEGVWIIREVECVQPPSKDAWYDSKEPKK